MQNFDYCTPTRLIFGQGVVEKLPEVMSRYGEKILMTYGVKRQIISGGNGVLFSTISPLNGILFSVTAQSWRNKRHAIRRLIPYHKMTL